MEWSPLGSPLPTYSTRMIYDIIREDVPTVSWHKEVWFGAGIPKHKFRTWLMVLNRCPTRMLQWGLQTDALCLLCNSHPESRSHIYFDCDYSWDIWSAISRRCALTTSRDWDSLLLQLQAFRGTNNSRKLLLLAWWGTIYSIWSERNNRLHRNSYHSTASIISEIDLTVRRRIASFRPSNPHLSSQLLQAWFSSRMDR